MDDNGRDDDTLIIEDLWYKNCIIYSLDLETFLDSDGDGIGDFPGLIRRLDYLEALGVDAIWLAPFHPSPRRDNGYDVADYYGVYEPYGSSGNFVEFMHQARKRGFRVIMDLVANHTSDRHPWFQEARKDPESRYRDFYFWSRERPKNMREGMMFPGVQEATWAFDEEAGAYYHHRFYAFQPDLNMTNKEVRAEIRRVIGYWLQLGVSGFRLDAVPFMLEAIDPQSEEAPERRYEYLDEIRQFLQWRSGDAILLGEANVGPEEMAPFLGASDGPGTRMHMMFNFHVNQYLFYTLATGDTGPLEEALAATREVPTTAQWAQFLRNHDELDLGQLSDEQRQAVFDRFAPEESMQLYGRGVRRRLAPMLGDRRREELAYSLMFSLPGSPVIRYGDELGMGDDLSLDERDAVRTPMQWADEPQGGFTASDDPVHPVISDGIYGHARVNAEAQRQDPDSLLNWMGRMIRLRKECPEIGWGSWQIVPAGVPGVLVMRFDWRGETLVTVHNFLDSAQEVELEVDAEGAQLIVDLLHDLRSEAADGVHRLALEPFGYHWYRVGGRNYGVARQSYVMQ